MPETDQFSFTVPNFGNNPVAFFKEVYAELKKVTWPTRPEIIRLTAIVIGVSVVVGVYLGGLDYAFTKLMGYILNR